MKTQIFKNFHCTKYMALAILFFSNPIFSAPQDKEKVLEQYRLETNSTEAAVKSSEGAPLSYAKLFQDGLFDWNRFQVGIRSGTNLNAKATIDVELLAAYEWQFATLGLGYHFKSAAYEAIRALPNNSGSEADLSTFPGEVARLREDGDAWTLHLLQAFFGVKGPLIFTDSHRFFQKADFGIQLGSGVDKVFDSRFSLLGFKTSGGIGFQLNKRISVEGNLAYNWLNAVRAGDEAQESRELPLHWLEVALGASFYF